MITFETYEDRINNPVRTDRHTYICILATEEEKQTWELEEPAEGFEWYYTEDTMPLSGFRKFIQLDLVNRKVGDSRFVSMS